MSCKKNDGMSRVHGGQHVRCLPPAHLAHDDNSGAELIETYLGPFVPSSKFRAQTAQNIILIPGTSRNFYLYCMVFVDYRNSHSSAGKRKFPLSEYALQVIQNLKTLNPNSEYICSSSKGTPITTNRFNEKLREYCKEAGIPYYSSHKIRFYAVSTMYDQGVNENTIQRLAGHSNLSTTRHYNRKLREYDLAEEILEKGFGLSVS